MKYKLKEWFSKISINFLIAFGIFLFGIMSMCAGVFAQKAGLINWDDYNKDDNVAHADTFTNRYVSITPELYYTYSYDFTTIPGSNSVFLDLHFLNNLSDITIVILVYNASGSSLLITDPTSAGFYANHPITTLNDSFSFYFDSTKSLTHVYLHTVRQYSEFTYHIEATLFSGNVVGQDYLQGYLLGKADGIKQSIVDINNTTANFETVQPIIGDYTIVDGSFTDVYTFSSSLVITDTTINVTSSSSPSGFSMRLNMALVPQRYYRLVYDSISIPPTDTQAFVAFRLSDTSFYKITPINKSDRTTYFTVDREVSELYIIYGRDSWSVTNLQLLSNEIDSVYEEGYSAGYTQGLNSSYDVIQEGSASYNAGYNHGVRSGSEYSFLSLAGAVVDAPIHTLTTMLDFDILGINMKSFYLSIFTLCIIITILRFVLVRK